MNNVTESKEDQSNDGLDDPNVSKSSKNESMSTLGQTTLTTTNLQTPMTSLDGHHVKLVECPRKDLERRFVRLQS